MRTTYSLLFLFVAFIIFNFSCVSAKKYEELRLVKEYYENESDGADSISGEYRTLFDELRQTESELKKAYHDIEQLTATNISLNKSYQDLLKRYNNLVGHNSEVIETYSYEKQLYDKRISEQQDALYNRGASPSNQPTNYDNDTSDLAGKLRSANTKISEMSQALAQKDAEIRRLQALTRN